MHTLTSEQRNYVEQFAAISNDLADWAEKQFSTGRSIDSVNEQLRRVMRVVAPLRKASEPPAPNVTQVKVEINFVWAENNPELFAQSVREFQRNHPITHWRHRVDLSREGFITFYTYRRPEPFESVQAYLADDKRFLREIGYVC